MSRTRRESAIRSAKRDLHKTAPVFAALGDDTRLALLAKLSEGPRCSIARLTAGSRLTRQAITKHLRVLQGAGLVRGVRQGRESLFELEPEPLDEARRALDRISRQWDQALARLKAFVETQVAPVIEDGDYGRDVRRSGRAADTARGKSPQE